MNIYLLSLRQQCVNTAQDLVFEWEDLWVDECNARVFYPQEHILIQWADRHLKVGRDLFHKVIKRTVGSYQLLQPFELPDPLVADSRSTLNVLIVTALFGGQLQILSSIPQWRKRFDVVVAYVFDAWDYKDYPAACRQLDHLFVPLIDVIQPLQKRLNIPVSLLPFATDVFQHGSNQIDRPIDLISFGRVPDIYHQAFSRHFNRRESSRLYLRTTPIPTQHFPTQPYLDFPHLLDRLQLQHLLRRSKMAIAFDTQYPGMRKFPYPFLTLRWFQGAGAGCVVVGKRPKTPLADQLFDWPDATIEFPDDPVASIDLIESLLQDQTRLETIYRRNYYEILRQHDWRHRMAQLLTTLNLPIPDKLQQTLIAIQQQSQQIATCSIGMY